MDEVYRLDKMIISTQFNCSNSHRGKLEDIAMNSHKFNGTDILVQINDI